MKFRVRTALWLVLGLGSISGTRTVHAQTPVEVEEARRQFALGLEDYQAGRLQDALVRFRRAHALSGAPELLYNLATVLERLRQDAEALERYEQYLEARPESEDRAAIEARIRMLRTEVGPALVTPATPEPPGPVVALEPTIPPVDAPVDPPAAAPVAPGPWALGVTAGVLTASGAALLVVAALDAQAVSEATTWAAAREPYDRAPWMSGLGLAGLGLGVAGVAGAVVWGMNGEGAPTTVAFGPGSVRIAGSF